MTGTRTVAALALVAALAATACDDGDAKPAPAGGGGAAAADAEPTVSVTVEPAAATVTLAEAVVLRVTVRNEGDANLTVSVPRLDRDTAAVRVRLDDGEPFVLERIVADQDMRTGEIKVRPPEAKELAPGESVTGELSLTAARVGAHHMTVSYRRSLTAPAVTADPVSVTVRPDDGRTSLGMRMETTEGAVTVRFRPDLAPNTVDAFASLVRRGFFDGLTFHRIIKGFMAQGGDPKGDGSGGPGFFLPLEAHRKLLHERGVLSMARTNVPDTAGSQFFLMFTAYPSLDPNPAAGSPGYTAFGQVVEGDETLTKLENVETQLSADIREQIEARGIPPEQVKMLIAAGRIPPPSMPVETVKITRAALVTLE